MSFKATAKGSGAGKDGGMVGLEGGFGLTGCFQETKVVCVGKRKNRDEARTRNERWEMDRQRRRCQSKIAKEAVLLTRKRSRGEPV